MLNVIGCITRQLARLMEIAIGRRPDTGAGESRNAPPPTGLDEEKLAALEAALPASAVKELLQLFVIDTENHLAELRRCEANGDFAGMARNAHVLTSTAGNMGVTALSEIARDMSGVCHARDAMKARLLVERMNGAYAAASGAIKARISSLSQAEAKAG